jgi:ABC-2 type transport system ATP-binding protein
MSAAAAMSQPILRIDAVSIKRGGRLVINKHDLRVAPGEVVAVFGSNGSGKSTLLTAIAGATQPHGGQILISDGEVVAADVWGSARAQQLARQHIGYVPENADPPGFLTGAELIALAASCRGTTLKQQDELPTWQRVVTSLDLEPLFATRIEHMSLGQRRRTCIAAALIGAPPLLVLDEPDNGLDAGRLQAVIELLLAHVANRGAVILATHDQPFATALAARRIEL